METMEINKEVLVSLYKKLQSLQTKINALTAKLDDKKLEEWLDAQDICELFKVLPRTLQNYRQRGILPYSTICGKCYYKPEDVEKLLTEIQK